MVRVVAAVYHLVRVGCVAGVCCGCCRVYGNRYARLVIKKG